MGGRFSPVMNPGENFGAPVPPGGWPGTGPVARGPGGPAGPGGAPSPDGPRHPQARSKKKGKRRFAPGKSGSETGGKRRAVGAPNARMASGGGNPRQRWRNGQGVGRGGTGVQRRRKKKGGRIRRGGTVGGKRERGALYKPGRGGGRPPLIAREGVIGEKRKRMEKWGFPLIKGGGAPVGPGGETKRGDGEPPLPPWAAGKRGGGKGGKEKGKKTSFFGVFFFPFNFFIFLFFCAPKKLLKFGGFFRPKGKKNFRGFNFFSYLCLPKFFFFFN